MHIRQHKQAAPVMGAKAYCTATPAKEALADGLVARFHADQHRANVCGNHCRCGAWNNRSVAVKRKYRLLDYTARLELEELWNGANALSAADIAREIGIHNSTLYRELERGRTSSAGMSTTLDCNEKHDLSCNNTHPLFRHKYSALKAQEAVNAGNRRRTGRPRKAVS